MCCGAHPRKIQKQTDSGQLPGSAGFVKISGTPGIELIIYGQGTGTRYIIKSKEIYMDRIDYEMLAEPIRENIHAVL